MSGIRSLYRGSVQKGYASAASAPIRVDSTSGQVTANVLGTGTVETALLAAYKPNAAIIAATHTPGAGDSGMLLTYSALAGIVVTLPAATGTGRRYKYFRSVAATSVGDVFKVGNATDYMRGIVSEVAKDDGLLTNWGTLNTGTVATESDTVTWNLTTTGLCDVGDWIEFIDITTAVWLVSSFYTANGAEATPFSAAQ